MKRIFLVFSLMLTISGLIGACTQRQSPAISTSSANPPIDQPKITETSLPQIIPTATPSTPDLWADVDPSNQQISFWHIFSDKRQQAINDLVDRFNAGNPYGIKVTAVSQGSYVDIYNKMLAVIGQVEAPDLITAFQNQAAEYQVKQGLVDLNSLVESPSWGFTAADTAAIFPGIWAADIYPTLSNQRLGIPFYRSVDMLYTNVDWLNLLGYANPPTTPDEFAQIACAAAKSPFITSAASQTSGTVFFVDASRLTSWVFAFGGDIFDYSKGKLDLNNDSVKNVLDFQRKLIADKCAVESTSWTEDQNLFMQGKTLFIMGSSSLIQYFTQSAQQGNLNFYWVATAFPHNGSIAVSNSYDASVSVSKTTPERELAAFIFLKFLLSSESQAQWAAASGTLPVRSDLADQLSQWFADYPWYKTAYELLPTVKSEPPLPGYDFVRENINDATSAILEGGDANEILGVLNDTANSIVASQTER